MENESFIWNGKPRQPLQIPRRGVWSKLGKAVRTKLADMLLPVKLASVLTLIVLAALLAGCATPSSPPSEGARNPLPPQIREPLPTESYLQRAQKLIESWQNAVTGM